MTDFVWQKASYGILGIIPGEPPHRHTISIMGDHRELRLVVFESPESLKARYACKMSELFKDLNNPTENEILMLELSLGINIRGYFELMRNDDES